MGRFRTICSCVALFRAALAATAAGLPGETCDKALAPYFFVPGDDPHTDRFPLKSTRVRVDIDGVIAEVSVTQRYSELLVPEAGTYEFLFPAVVGPRCSILDETRSARRASTSPCGWPPPSS